VRKVTAASASTIDGEAVVKHSLHYAPDILTGDKELVHQRPFASELVNEGNSV
jgi:hypothetical protein